MPTGNQRGTTNQLSILVLFLSIILGAIGCLVTYVIFQVLSSRLPGVLNIGINFLIFAIIFVLGMVLINVINGNMSYHTAKFHDGGKITLMLILSILVIFIFGTLFEFIYELDFFKIKRDYSEPTSYVFIIDVSGSMDSSDPEGKRYEAVNKIMAQKSADFPYAVYTFDDEVYLERELGPASNGSYNYNVTVGGGTRIKLVLELLLKDYKDGKLKDLGAAPKFILLSDGFPTDIDNSNYHSFEKVLAQYAQTPISISTVGLIQADTDLMQEIADITGGVFINIDDAGQLEQSMTTAASTISQSKFNRNLFSYRIVPSFGIVYAAMRIIFLAILAFLLSATALFSSGKGDDKALILISSLITAILAGTLVEVGINIIGIPSIFARFTYFILAAMTFITVYGIAGRGDGQRYNYDMTEFGHGTLQMGETRGIGSGAGAGRPRNMNGGTVTHSAGGDFFSDFEPTSPSNDFNDSFSNFDDMGSSNSGSGFDSFDDFDF